MPDNSRDGMVKVDPLVSLNGAWKNMLSLSEGYKIFLFTHLLKESKKTLGNTADPYGPHSRGRFLLFHFLSCNYPAIHSIEHPFSMD